jgi:hypothetical protein
MRGQQAAGKAGSLTHGCVAVAGASQAALSAPWAELGEPDWDLQHLCRMRGARHSCGALPLTSECIVLTFWHATISVKRRRGSSGGRKGALGRRHFMCLCH